MTQWWQWSGEAGAGPGGFAVIGVGRFGSSVCAELLRSGAEVLAAEASGWLVVTMPLLPCAGRFSHTNFVPAC